MAILISAQELFFQVDENKFGSRRRIGIEKGKRGEILDILQHLRNFQVLAGIEVASVDAIKPEDILPVDTEERFRRFPALQAAAFILYFFIARVIHPAKRRNPLLCGPGLRQTEEGEQKQDDECYRHRGDIAGSTHKLFCHLNFHWICSFFNVVCLAKKNV